MPEPTGLRRVDDVMTAVAQVEERPIDEHVGVFETAHGALRAALDPEPDEQDGADPDPAHG